MLPRSKNIFALVRRDYVIARSYRLAFILDLFFGLMNLATFYFISRIFEGAPASLGAAPDYFAFAAVGVVIALVVQAASTGLARRVREEQLVGTFELLVAQPVTSGELAIGLAGFPFAFAVTRAVFYLATAGIVLQLDVSQTDWPGLALMLCVSAIALMPIGIGLSALVIIFKRGEVLASVVTFGLGLLGGSLFPIAELPSGIAVIGRAMPTRFALDGVRQALFAGEDYLMHAGTLALFGVVGIPVTIWMLDRSIKWSCRRGTLSQY